MCEISREEQVVVDLLRRRGGIDVRSLSWVTYLPTPAYLMAIQTLLDAGIEDEIPEEIRFVTKLCFSDRRAKPHYRRIYEWWEASQGDVERPSFEMALSRTYGPSECRWTWEQIRSLPEEDWPMSLIRRLWADGAPRKELRERVLSFLDSGQARPFQLREIFKIDDAKIREWFVMRVPADPFIARLMRGARGDKQRVETVDISGLAQCGFRTVFSVELDEDEADRVLREVNRQLEWRGVVSALRSECVTEGRFTVVWRDRNPKRGRIVIATREDDTTLILQWLAKGEELFPAVRLS